MNKKNSLIAAFVLLAFVQLYVPAKMILNQEDVLNKGREFKFKTAPIDPNDPFRGKYITLRFDANEVVVANTAEWTYNESIFVAISEDAEGYVQLDSLMKKAPAGTHNYVKARIDYIRGDDSYEIGIEFPFERYYMEESKAYDAELAYAESQVDSTQVAYALVAIKDGEAALKDVLINEESIREIVERRLKEK